MVEGTKLRGLSKPSALFVFGGAALIACSSASSTDDAAAQGGAAGLGAAAGETSRGGASSPDRGGSANQGGTNASQGGTHNSAGGAEASGSAGEAGEVATAGGALAQAGSNAQGGTPAQSGATSSGGASQGGALAQGGAISSGGASQGGAPAGGQGGAAHGGTVNASGGAGGSAPTYSVVCSSEVLGSLAKPSSEISVALWWNNSWLLASGAAIGTFANDGSAVLPWRPYVATDAESASRPSVALLQQGPLVGYSSVIDADTTSVAKARLVQLNQDLQIQGTALDIGPAFSGETSLAPDGHALAWGQGYPSMDEGYRFATWSSAAGLGVIDKATSILPSASGPVVTNRGDGGFFAFYRQGCPQLQRYDASGKRVGAFQPLKPEGKNCPNDTNYYPLMPWEAAVQANGTHFVAFNESGGNTQPSWMAYAVIDDASAAIKAVRTVSAMETLRTTDTPSVAAFDGRFAIAWWTGASSPTKQIKNYFVLIGADGAQLAAPLFLGQGPYSDNAAHLPAPVVAAGPDGFVVFAPTSDGTYALLKISCS